MSRVLKTEVQQHHVIIVDDTYLQEKYKGMLLIVTCIDGNNNIYPIAFFIVDYETWSWFMINLRALVGSIMNLVIIFDRYLFIKFISLIFPEAFHVLIIYHIWNNLMDGFKNKDVILHFYIVFKTYKMFKFQIYWSKLDRYPSVTAYLEDIGLAQ